MKKLVISLQRRTDRKKEFYKNNLTNYQFIKAIDYKRLNNFIVDENFRDPFKNRPVLKSEVACFLSHKKAWEECLKLNDNILYPAYQPIKKKVSYNLDKQLNRGSYSISFAVKDRMNNEARKTIYFSIN